MTEDLHIVPVVEEGGVKYDTRYVIPKAWKDKFLEEPLRELPKRMNDAFDMIRTERKNADARYAALDKRFQAEKVKNHVLMAVLGAAAYKGFEVSAVLLWHILMSRPQ